VFQCWEGWIRGGSFLAPLPTDLLANRLGCAICFNRTFYVNTCGLFRRVGYVPCLLLGYEKRRLAAGATNALAALCWGVWVDYQVAALAYSFAGGAHALGVR
jgi:hypothetical protein